MVIGRAQDDHIGPVYPHLQFGISGQVVSGVRVVKRERLLFEIEHIDRAAGGLELLGNVADDDARYRIALQAADHGQDTQSCFTHSRPNWRFEAATCSDK